MVKTNNHLLDKLLKKEKPPSLVKGKEVEAEVVFVSKKNVVFNIGGKTEAILGQEELINFSPYLSYLKPGEKIKVRIITPEARDGYPVVSLKKFFSKDRWKFLSEKKEKEELIEVIAGEYGRGGVFVDFMGIRGVIPKIQLYGEAATNPKIINGKKIKVKVLEVDEKKNRLVVSQKAAVLNISQKELKKKFDQIKENERYKAKILGVSEFGVFCEVNGVEGLVHVSEVSWEKINSPVDLYKAGDLIDVLVIKKNQEDYKLNLSIKRLTKDPWQDIEKKYPKNKEIVGKIVRQEKYGYIVRFEPGVEGLIHISKINNKENLVIGKKIGVYIEKINKKNRRISLLLPQKERPVTYR